MKKYILNKSQSQRVASLLLLALKNDDAEASLYFLYGVLTPLFDIKKLTLFQYTHETKSFLNLCAIVSQDEYKENKTAINSMEIPIAYPRPSQDMRYDQPVVSRLLTLEDISLFHDDIGNLYDSGYVARIPLYMGESFSLFLACYTSSDVLLSDDELKSIMFLTKDFGTAIAEKVRNASASIAEQKFSLPSSSAVIEMCNGLKAVDQHIKIVASSNVTVLITGETGTGKEVIAESIQSLSTKKDKAFIKINCGALPETIIDSLLFGHEKGSFTGAYNTQIGYFEQANGGTIFLDEIGELPLLSQTHLLRVLDKKEIQRIGSAKNVSLDIRIIAATNKDLVALVKEGKFREDLWYRLCSYIIEIPPLRKRKVDILTLANYYLKIKSKELELHFTPKLSESNTQELLNYHWHGNVRELMLIIEKSLLVLKYKCKAKPKVSNLVFDFQEGTNFANNTTTPLTLDEIYAQNVQEALKKSNGQVFGEKGAAKILGIHPNTLKNFLKKMEK